VGAVEAAIQARLLGPFQVSVAGRLVVHWERPSVRRLLQYLLLHPGRAVSRDELMEALFPTLDADQGSNALAKALSMARAALGPGLVESTRSYVRLAQPVETDLQTLEAGLEAALVAPAESRVASLRTALAVGGDPVPEERYADWPEAARDRIADLRRRCRLDLARASASEGPAAAAAAWEAAFSADPSNEEAAEAAIRAHAQVGERHLAGRVYERCRAALADELGVEPSAKLERVYRQAVFADAAGGAESDAWQRAGRERLSSGDQTGADTAFARALELAGDLESRSSAWVGLASVPYRKGDMAAVIDLCRTALDSLPGGPSPGCARLLCELGWAEVRAGRPGQGRPHLERAAEMLRGDPGTDPDLAPRAFDRLALARSDCGDHGSGLEAMEEAFRKAPSARPHMRAVLRLHRGRLLGRLGRAEEGLGDVAAARRVFESLENRYSTSVACWLAAELLDQLGLVDRALAERQAEIALLRRIENPRNEAGALIHVTDLLGRLGRLSEAEVAAREALDVALRTGDPRLVAWARERQPKHGKVSGKHQS
jgi:DNA-binding SARP family transcriptional activator